MQLDTIREVLRQAIANAKPAPQISLAQWIGEGEIWASWGRYLSATPDAATKQAQDALIRRASR